MVHVGATQENQNQNENLTPATGIMNIAQAVPPEHPEQTERTESLAETDETRLDFISM